MDDAARVCDVQVPGAGGAGAGGAAMEPGLVHDLMRAAIHSRAAYGYAMQAGHVASVLSFALMHTVHSLR